MCRKPAYNLRVKPTGLILWLTVISSTLFYPHRIFASEIAIAANKDAFCFSGNYDSVPKRCERMKTLSIRGARGEYESAQVLISSKEDLDDVRVVVSDLHKGGQTISADSVNVRIVKEWFQAPGAWVTEKRLRRGKSQLVPELLLYDDTLVRVDEKQRKNFLRVSKNGRVAYVDISRPAKLRESVIHSATEFGVKDATQLLPFDLKRDNPKSLWLTVKIPNEAIAGTYSGELRLYSRNEEKGSMRVELQVHPFELGGSEVEYSIYYRGKLDPARPTISSEFKSEHQLEAELQNMVAHGIDNPTLYQRLKNKPPRWVKKSEENTALLRRHIELRKSAGISSDRLYYLGHVIGFENSAKSYRRLRDALDFLRSVKRDQGIAEMYLYGRDEAKGKALLSQRKSLAIAKSKGFKVFVAGQEGAFAKLGRLTDMLVLFGSPSLREASRIQSRGGRVFSYHNPQSGPEDPMLFRKNYGIDMWKYGYDGVMIYAYQHSMGSIWNDFDHQIYRDHVMAYPTVEGVIDTLAWEALREAKDDVRYINSLERQIERHEHELLRKSKIVREAESYLDNIWQSDEYDPDQVRRTVVRYLGSLTVTSGELALAEK